MAGRSAVSGVFSKPGVCRVKDCEVTLHVQDGELFACKHRLQVISKYFAAHFANEFVATCELRDEASFEDVSLFLECVHGTVGADLLETRQLKPIPSDLKQLTSLLKTADTFKSELLRNQITNALPSILRNYSAEHQLAILDAAFKHRGERSDAGVKILEVCVRSCAKLDHKFLESLHGNGISPWILTAIYELKSKASGSSLDRKQQKVCRYCNSGSGLSPSQDTPNKQKTYFCKKCDRYLQPGEFVVQLDDNRDREVDFHSYLLRK